MKPTNLKLAAVRIGLALLFGVLAVISVQAQQTREIISDDFTKNRPAASSESRQKPSVKSSRVGQSKPHRTYRLASKPAAKSTGGPGKKVLPLPEVAQLGITIWRLRPARMNDTGARQLVRNEAGPSEWIPERIEADTLIRAGDRIRLSIESPRDGYLYVVNRDEFADGRSGAINLIFPLAGEDNRVYAGRLIDIPSPEGSIRANPAPNQSGEDLSIIVTSTPLNLRLSGDVLTISRAQLTEWERLWGGTAEVWEMQGGAGEAWTAVEQQAAAKRGTRQLTRDDPAPQTIYRVSPADKRAMLVNVLLRYGN